MENSAQLTETMAPAGFWLRAGAYMLDLAVLIVSGAVLGLVGALLHLPILAALLSLVGTAAYFSWMPAANHGQTLGKMAAGIAIVRNDGEPISWGRALARFACYSVSSLTLYIGFLIAAFTENKRALHDFIAGTRVVVAKPVAGARKFCVIAFGVLCALAIPLGILAAVSIPSFLKMKQKAAQSVTVESLTTLRTALASYQADNARYPQKLDELVPKYIDAIPEVRMGEQGSSGVTYYDASACDGKSVRVAAVKDADGWGYVGDPAAPCGGTLFVSSTQNDAEGNPWYSH